MGSEKELCDFLSYTTTFATKQLRAFKVLTVHRGRQISKRATITQFDKHYDAYLKNAVRAGEEEHLKE